MSPVETTDTSGNGAAARTMHVQCHDGGIIAAHQ